MNCSVELVWWNYRPAVMTLNYHFGRSMVSFCRDEWSFTHMNYIVLTIYDSAVEAYSPPFCVRAIGEGLRSFIAEVNNANSRISKSPHDFSLFELGRYDDGSGLFDLLAAPRCVARAHEHVNTGS